MGSKTIFDSPDLLDESLVSLTAACKCFPVKCSRPAIERWIRKGSRGTVLETVLICGRRHTSKEAIHRFCRNQLQIEPERCTPKRSDMSRKDIETAARRFRLPVPQRTMRDFNNTNNNTKGEFNHD